MEQWAGANSGVKPDLRIRCWTFPGISDFVIGRVDSPHAMSAARYFLPDHPKLTDVYSKGELRAMLQAGQLSRSDMVTDDETGKGYLLGDLLMTPFPDVAVVPLRSTNSLQTRQPSQTQSHEFRADTPLPRVEREELDEDDDREDEEEEEIPQRPTR